MSIYASVVIVIVYDVARMNEATNSCACRRTIYIYIYTKRAFSLLWVRMMCNDGVVRVVVTHTHAARSPLTGFLRVRCLHDVSVVVIAVVFYCIYFCILFACVLCVLVHAKASHKNVDFATRFLHGIVV